MGWILHKIIIDNTERYNDYCAIRKEAFKEIKQQGDRNQKSNIVIYTTEDGLTKIETAFDGDTVWLSIDQMAELFQRDRSVIGKHVRNIFKEGEVIKESVWAKFAYTAADGKI